MIDWLDEWVRGIEEDEMRRKITMDDLMEQGLAGEQFDDYDWEDMKLSDPNLSDQ